MENYTRWIFFESELFERRDDKRSDASLVFYFGLVVSSLSTELTTKCAKFKGMDYIKHDSHVYCVQFTKMLRIYHSSSRYTSRRESADVSMLMWRGIFFDVPMLMWPSVEKRKGHSGIINDLRLRTKTTDVMNGWPYIRTPPSRNFGTSSDN